MNVLKVVKTILIVAFVGLLTWLCSFLFISCNPSKKLQTAENRVLADVESVKRVREKTNQLFPCSNDSVVTKIHDTTTNTLVKTVTKTDTITKDGIRYVFRIDTAFFEKTKTVYQDKIVTDHELTNRQKDTINAIRLREATQTGTIAELRTIISDTRREANKWKWFFIGLLVASVLSHIIRSRIPQISMFKKS